MYVNSCFNCICMMVLCCLLIIVVLVGGGALPLHLSTVSVLFLPLATLAGLGAPLGCLAL